jgi:hypothetical protein
LITGKSGKARDLHYLPALLFSNTLPRLLLPVFKTGFLLLKIFVVFL